MRSLLVPLLLLGTLAGCGLFQSTKVDNSVLAAAEALTTAETAAALYTQLPACGTGAPAVCAGPAVVAKIRSLDDTAYTAVKAAEANKGTIAAALSAIAAFRAAIPASAS